MDYLATDPEIVMEQVSYEWEDDHPGHCYVCHVSRDPDERGESCCCHGVGRVETTITHSREVLRRG